MGIRSWWAQFTQGLQRGRGPSLAELTPQRTRAEQDADREGHRQAGMSSEDRAWEQASQQRARDRQATPGTPSSSTDA